MKLEFKDQITLFLQEINCRCALAQFCAECFSEEVRKQEFKNDLTIYAESDFAPGAIGCMIFLEAFGTTMLKRRNEKIAEENRFSCKPFHKKGTFLFLFIYGASSITLLIASCFYGVDSLMLGWLLHQSGDFYFLSPYYPTAAFYNLWGQHYM